MMKKMTRKKKARTLTTSKVHTGNPKASKSKNSNGFHRKKLTLSPSSSQYSSIPLTIMLVATFVSKL